MHLQIVGVMCIFLDQNGTKLMFNENGNRREDWASHPVSSFCTSLQKGRSGGKVSIILYH